MIENFKVGADIEVFLMHKDTKEIVSAEGMIQGSKDFPFVFEEPFYATSLDNVMAEFCIPPATSPSEFYMSIQKALKYINKTIPKHLKAAAIPAAFLDSKYLQTENAMLFGCIPDFNAWTLQENPAASKGGTLRTCGGHVHIGYEEPQEHVNIALVKAMDLFVGVPSILFEPSNPRKMMYGKAGSFRHKQYGVEYRTISNYYLESKSLTNWVFDNTVEAINFVNKGSELSTSDESEIVDCINQSDEGMAFYLVSKFDIKLAA